MRAPTPRAGRRVMAGFEGAQAPPALIKRVRAGEVGGVILFQRNVESAVQVAALLRALQDAARSSPSGEPLLVGIDQEGGRVNRLSPDFTTFPPARAFGRAGEAALAREAARITGRELAAVGVNVNFAPVADVLTNPDCAVIGDRAYGEEPEVVARMAEAVAAGLAEGGVAACAKHFPGIGDMAPDPHEVLPACDLAPDTLRARELLAFRRLMANPPACVMVAHAVYTQIDPDAPASLSPRFLRDILRGEVGFGGVSITDDLDMGAIEGTAGAALRAVEAGADVALICHSQDAQQEAVAAIARAIAQGRIPGEEASAGRIRKMKEVWARPAVDPAVVGCAEHLRARERILKALERARP